MTDILRYLKRNNFFTGRLLTAEDRSLEQEYFREKLKRHNRFLHGFGVVFGLDVSRRTSEVLISSGLALDCVGNDLIVPEPAKLTLPDPERMGETIFIGLEFVEREVDPTPGNSSLIVNSRIEEIASAVFMKQNSNSGHRHIKGRG
ncbi:MAG: hypothetical protein ACRD8U_01985 [Pyrinomonadaceae bacterium]